MEKIIYYTPEEVLNLVFTGVDGKILISKASLFNMIKRGDIPAEQFITGDRIQHVLYRFEVTHKSGNQYSVR